MPRQSTHGHHQAATLLALEVVQQLNAQARPVVLGAEPGAGAQVEEYAALSNLSVSATTGPGPEFTFDRLLRFGYQNALTYEIVVQWVISEHKSQGMFQNDAGKHNVEHFWRF